MPPTYPTAQDPTASDPTTESALFASPFEAGAAPRRVLIVYDRRRAPFSFLPFLVRARAGHFDLTLDLQRHLKSGIVSIASGARMRVGFDRSNGKEFNYLFSTRRIAPQPP